MTINTSDRYVIITTPWDTITPGLKNKINRLEKLNLIEEKNAEENQQLMLDFNITKIPTLMLVNSGKEVKRLEGIITMDQLKEFFGV